jgi:hypothetical protein
MATATPPPPVADNPLLPGGKAKSASVSPAVPVVPLPHPELGIDEHPGDRIALMFWMICFLLLALMTILEPMLKLFR